MTGHLDQRIYRFYFDEASRGVAHWELCRHSCVPYALSWGEAVCAAGPDQMVCFYDKEGMLLQRFDYSRDETEKEFTCATFNPSGETVVVGSFNRFRIFTVAQDGTWTDAGMKQVENLYTVTALSWKCDGSRLTVGSLCGAVDMYDACIRRVRYKGKFEFTYVSASSVIVKRLSTGARIVLKSHFGYEVAKINIYEDRFLVASTHETLLMGDLETCAPRHGCAPEQYSGARGRVLCSFVGSAAGPAPVGPPTVGSSLSRRERRLC